jgi:hypothetical protein
MDAPEEFRPYLNSYTDLLVSLELKHQVVKEYIETRLPNDEGFSGTPDYAMVGGDGTGVILDVKYGTGIQVEAEGNMQLMSYASLLLDQHPELERFKLIIFQPRCDPQVKDCELTKDDVEEFKARRQRIKDVAEGEGKDAFSEGSHCQFCPRMLDCPLKVEPARDMIAVAEGKDVISMQPQEIFKIAAMESKIKEVFRDAKAIIESGLRDGTITSEESGFKIVGTSGNRAWEEGVSDELVARYGEETVSTKKILSPNQLETVIRKQGGLTPEEKEFIGSKVVRKSGMKLVPNSHKGQHLFADRNDFTIEKGDV